MRQNKRDRAPGYDALDAASRLPDDSDHWWAVVRGLKLEPWIAPAVQQILRQRKWRSDPNPTDFVRTESISLAATMGLHADDHKGGPARSRRGDVGTVADLKLPAAAWAQDGERRDYAAAHDRFIDLKYLDYVDLLWRSGRQAIDPKGSYEYDEETGERYYHNGVYGVVPFDLLKRVEPTFLPGYGDTHGCYLIDWSKVAEKAGLNSAAARVLELRYGLGYSREEILDAAKNEKERLALQAAYKMVSVRRPQIEDLLGAQWRRGLAAKAQPPKNHLQVAPPVRSTSLLRPAPEDKDKEVLGELDRRFGNTQRRVRR